MEHCHCPLAGGWVGLSGWLFSDPVNWSTFTTELISLLQYRCIQFSSWLGFIVNCISSDNYPFVHVCHCAVSRVQWWQCILEWKSHVLRCQPGPSGACCASVSGVFWRTYYWRQLTTVQASHVAVSVSVNSPPCMQLSTDHHINLKIANITSHTRHCSESA